MSSTYRILCLSHDPAIVLNNDYDTNCAAAVAVLNPGSHPEVENHKDCDLLIGRYSYPLVEVGCAGAARAAFEHPAHSEIRWIGTGLLRIAALALTADRPNTTTVVVDELPGYCWTAKRIERLRSQL
jgi:hypothetical protein